MLRMRWYSVCSQVRLLGLILVRSEDVLRYILDETQTGEVSCMVLAIIHFGAVSIALALVR